MRDFVTKTAFLGERANDLFKSELESLEQRRHFILNVRHVGDGGISATAALGCDSNALHGSRPARFVRPMTRSVNAEGVDFYTDGIWNGKEDAAR